MNRLLSSSSEKLHEAGLDQQGAAAAMSKYLGRLHDWVHTYIPHNCPPPVNGILEPQMPSLGVSSNAAPVLNLGGRGGGGRGGGGAALLKGAQPPPAAARRGDWKGGPLDMGPNSWNGGS